jgi:hypothetical protein
VERVTFVHVQSVSQWRLITSPQGWQDALSSHLEEKDTGQTEQASRTRSTPQDSITRSELSVSEWEEDNDEDHDHDNDEEEEEEEDNLASNRNQKCLSSYSIIFSLIPKLFVFLGLFEILLVRSWQRSTHDRSVFLSINWLCSLSVWYCPKGLVYFPETSRKPGTSTFKQAVAVLGSHSPGVRPSHEVPYHHDNDTQLVIILPCVVQQPLPVPGNNTPSVIMP